MPDFQTKKSAFFQTKMPDFGLKIGHFEAKMPYFGTNIGHFRHGNPFISGDLDRTGNRDPKVHVHVHVYVQIQGADFFSRSKIVHIQGWTSVCLAFRPNTQKMPDFAAKSGILRVKCPILQQNRHFEGKMPDFYSKIGI